MRESARSAESFSFRFGSRQTRLGSLDEQIAFKLGDGGDNLHRHLSRRAREVGPAKGKAMNANAEPGQSVDGGAHIHGVAAQAIELGDDQNISGLQLVHEADETAPLRGGDAAGDSFGDDAARLDIEARGFDFPYRGSSSNGTAIRVQAASSSIAGFLRGLSSPCAIFRGNVKV